jgi:hypothetical protein
MTESKLYFLVGMEINENAFLIKDKKCSIKLNVKLSLYRKRTAETAIDKNLE